MAGDGLTEAVLLHRLLKPASRYLVMLYFYIVEVQKEQPGRHCHSYHYPDRHLASSIKRFDHTARNPGR